jgi:DNA primase
MAEGFELTLRGKSWRGLCPLHDREGRNPSFVAWESGWKCYSCGEAGDGPAFIMKLKGLTFPQAMAYLGQEFRRPNAQCKAKQAKERRKKRDAEWRERELARTLGIAIRQCHEALRDIAPENFDDHALILTELETLNYQHDILIYGDQAERASLVRELAWLRPFKRTLLFRRNFDYLALLRATNNKSDLPVVDLESQNERNRIKVSFI